MRLLCTFFFLVTSVALAATQEVPSPRLDPLADRILFLVALWSVIAILIVILRWKISLADALFRMMPPEAGKSNDATRRGNPDPGALGAKDSGEGKKEAPPLL